MRRLLALAAALLTLWTGLAAASGRDELYQARSIVSGTMVATRREGLARCLADVLVKVSGNPALADDPRLSALDPQAILQDFAYIDRQSDMPRHDEQGSRDRPFTLIAQFDPKQVDAALAGLGETPWLADRPPLLVRVAVRDRQNTFRMTAEGDDDERHREALLAAADRYAMRVVLPPANGYPDAAGPPGAVVLAGTLAWSDTDFGWVGTWHLDWQGKGHDWRIAGVSFDAAFRNAVSGAMAILSGHALP
jgi:uncharacterized protein